jgi:hypothetical protein
MTAPLLSRKSAICVKVEGAKGEPEIASLIDLYASDVKMICDASFEPRDGAGTELGNTTPGIVTQGIGRCTFQTELMAYTGHALNPGLAALLQACALAQSSQTYQVHSTFANQKTVTIEYYQDGLKKVLFGAMGKPVFNGTAGKRIIISFEFLGLYSVPVVAALPTFAPAVQKPMLMQSGSFTMGTVAKYISRFSFDMQNVLGWRYNPSKAGGIECAIITNFNPVFSCDPEVDADLAGVPTSNFESLWRAGTEQAVSFVASDGTDKATFVMPKVQPISVPMEDREGILVYDYKGQCNKSAGNDSFALTIATV